jgi:phosphoglycerate kinase
VILLSHLGRPKGKPETKYSLQPVMKRLTELLPGYKVGFVESTDSDDAQKATHHEAINVLLLENTRFLGGEEANEERLARGLAQLGDLFVNDAFGAAHRAHASTEAVAHVLKPAVAGFLLERELRYLGALLEQPRRPFVAVLGGAKVSGKIDLIENLLPRVDELLIGGAMACTFFKAMGLEVGNSLVEDDRVELARHLMEKAGERLVLPAGCVIAAELREGVTSLTVRREKIPGGFSVFDIDPATADRYASRIRQAGTVLWNGPMGVFETPPFDQGTRVVAEAMGEATKAGAVTVVGGGDSAAAVARYGVADQMTHVSTGGGASLELLEGRTLPGVAALDDA